MFSLIRNGLGRRRSARALSGADVRHPAPTYLLAGLVAIAISAAASVVAAQDPAASRLLSEAERLRDSGDLRAALVELELLSQQFPSDALSPRALLEVARLNRILGEERRAELALDRLLQNFPRTQEAASAFLIQGEMAVEKARSAGEVRDALKSLRRVPLLFGAERFPDLPARSKALVRHGELSLLLDDAESAIADFVAVVEDEPKSAHTDSAALLLGRTLINTGQLPQGLEVLQRLADSGTSREEAATARRLLSLTHRLVIRPQNGQRPWQQAEQLTIPGYALREASALASSPEGDLLVLDGRSDQIALYDLEEQRTELVTIDNAVRPAWYGNTAYVITREEVRLPFAGQKVRFLEPRSGRETPLKNLRAAIRGPFGDWFVLAKGWRSLLSYQSPRVGQELLAVAKPDLIDLESDSLGRILALDKKSDAVLRLGVDRRTKSIVVRGADWKRPEALALDALGNLYVLDRGTRQISVYTQAGQRITTLGPNLGSGIELREPRDLTVDGSGRLLIADAKLPYIVMMD